MSNKAYKHDGGRTSLLPSIRRHRRWDCDCLASYADFRAIQYDTGEVAALVLFNPEHLLPLDMSHPGILAIHDYAVHADVPAFVCRYGNDMSWWHPTPLNAQARALLPESRRLSEREWFKLFERADFQKVRSE